MVERVARTIRESLEGHLTPGDRRFLEGLLVGVVAHLDSSQESGQQFQAEAEQTLESLMLPATFGQRLGYYRGRAGISQINLAKHIGMEPAYLSRIEHGRVKPPKLDRVLMMARVLHLPPAHILGLVELAGHPQELLLQFHIP